MNVAVMRLTWFLVDLVMDTVSAYKQVLGLWPKRNVVTSKYSVSFTPKYHLFDSGDRLWQMPFRALPKPQLAVAKSGHTTRPSSGTSMLYSSRGGGIGRRDRLKIC